MQSGAVFTLCMFPSQSRCPFLGCVPNQPLNANFSITFSTPSGADVIPESCLNPGNLCWSGASVFYPTGRVYEAFTGNQPSLVTITVESCVGNPVLAVCRGFGGSNCSDVTNPTVSVYL
jgi:hypothetical protein